MNKIEFMDKMERDLAPMPDEERSELLARCEAVFRIGREQGKTEEEIAAELSGPSTQPEPRFEPPYGTYGLAPDRAPLPPPPWSAARPEPGRQAEPVRDTPRIVGVTILLFFLNVLFAIPVFAALGAAFLAVCSAALATLLSPLALAAETLLYGEFTNAKLMLALGAVGIGMILADLALVFGKGLLRLTRTYAGWNIRTLKGSKER
ncbi:hypothetical protein [Cohnella hongkongensis]|uniref:DUF1700 domain-containing protein n=1 Tax=Cohnella hongkongensis TaxID=178337 RepID=A0ABV9FGC9_9BACL